MKVAICNLSQVPAPVVEHAKAEVSYVFRTMDVEIQWLECDQTVGARDEQARPDFIVRVQVGGRTAMAGPVFLDAMGRAFMDETGYGYMVDTYYGAISDLTRRFPVAGSDQLLGYTIVHELGHLLIGAGHRPEGIMRPSWSKAELEALNHRSLRFSSWERATIVRNLKARRNATRP